MEHKLTLDKARPNDFFFLAGAGIAYYLAALAGMSLFSLQPANITLIWLAAGIGLVMALTWGFKAAPFILLASFCANLPGMTLAHSLAASLMHTLVAAAIDTATPLFALLLLRRFLARGITHAQDLFLFALFGCALPVLLSSLLLTANLLLGHYIPPASGLNFVKMLFFADSLGILLVYHIYIGWQKVDGAIGRANVWLFGSQLALLGIFGLGIFYQQWWMFYLIPPLLVIAAFELTLLSVALLNSACMLVIILATAHGMGPFSASSPLQGNADMMAFVFASSLTIFGISLQNSQLQRTEKDKVKAEKEAQLDPLTGLLNRRSFEPLLQRIHQQAKDKGTHYSLAMLDLDHFKEVNDHYGHACGDAVIKQLAGTILAQCREQDRPARIGGEEFAILLMDTDINNARTAMERIRTLFMITPITSDSGEDIATTVSIGLAAFSQQATAAEVLAAADGALYEAKNKGRNQVVARYQTLPKA